MADYVTGDLGDVPTIGASAEIKQYLDAMITILDARLVDYETRISALEDA